MSILSGIMKFGGKPSVNFVKKGAAATSELLKKKVNVSGWNVDTLLRSPQADAFIRSSAKQKAKILSDNIVRLNDGGMPYRVITKRLPSGTTIAQAFDFNGKAFKEVISKGAKAFSSHEGIKNSSFSSSVLVQDYVKGITKYKPSLHYPKDVKTMPINVKVNDSYLQKVDGLTALVNAKNADYQALKKMEMVY